MSASLQDPSLTVPAPPKGERRGSVGIARNLGLVIALVILCVVGVVTAGDRFASTDNLMTILRLATVTGIVAVGMTFVITGGGIDLSVGAIVALASVWATTTGTQAMADNIGWIAMVFSAIVVGAACGAINGVLVAYGRIVPFVATLAMLASARGLAEVIADRKTQILRNQGFTDFFGAEPLGIPVIVIIFALTVVAGWFLLNRTTFGRRTFAVGGNPEAARLAGIKVQRHTVYLYTLLGTTCGIAAVMLMSRTTVGSSTHGTLLELDVIAAVVIGGTLLTGGTGYVLGSLIGVLVYGTIKKLISFMGAEQSWTQIIIGFLLLVFIVVQRVIVTRSQRRT